MGLGRQIVEDGSEDLVPVDDDDWVEAVSKEVADVHPDVTEEWKPMVWLD